MTTHPSDFVKFKGLKIGHYNIRSLHHKFSHFYDLVKMYDILCVSESWTTDAYPDNKLRVPGYQFYRYDRVVDKVGGGLLIYVINRMAPYCSIDPALMRSNADIEIMVLNFTQDKHRLTSIIHVYRPPNGSYVKCLETLVEVVQNPSLNGREHWVIGDINVDLFHPSDSKTKAYKSSIEKLNLVDIIDNITRPYPNRPGGTCIDLIATNCDVVSHHGTLPHLVSDHLPIYAVKKKPKEVYTIISMMGRSYKTFDPTDINDYLLSIDWTNFDTNHNVDDKWSIMINHIVSWIYIVQLKKCTLKTGENPGCLETFMNLFMKEIYTC